jgi:hypothetical protein
MSEAAWRGMTVSSRPVPDVRLKSVALPAEHGGWGMLAEPIFLGLLVAPSWAGAGVGLVALGAFLARHPLKLAVADRRRRSRSPRTAAAERFALLYVGLAVAGLLLARHGEPGWWLPLAVAAPLGLIQFTHDAGHRGRQLLPELVGALALGAVAAAEMLAAGSALHVSLAAWAILGAKAVGAVLYVRTRLRRGRGLAPARLPALAVHTSAVVLGLALAVAGAAPWLVAALFAVLLARAAHGLSVERAVRPQVVGIQEMAYGLAFVLILALGYRLGL